LPAFDFYEKITNGEKPSVTGFCHCLAEFQPLSPDFSYCCWILTMEVGIQQQWPNLGQFHRNLA